MSINHIYFKTQSAVRSACSLNEGNMGSLDPEAYDINNNNKNPLAKAFINKTYAFFPFCQLLIS